MRDYKRRKSKEKRSLIYMRHYYATIKVNANRFTEKMRTNG